ncbi:hypothetical protein GA0115236_161528 [Streptomyces sp. IgraMP-1]|nr:hypothetical protein GA0115236_161528 [Streptomyces sp. IgraMP-1]
MGWGPDPAARLRLTELKAALLDRIAVEEGRPEATVQAEEARALAAQLRAEIDGPRSRFNDRRDTEAWTSNQLR